MRGNWWQYWQASGQSEGSLWLQQCPVALGSCRQKNQNMNCMFWGVGGPECFEGVVGVHDWVDHVVHHHEPPNIGGEVAKAVEDGYEDAKVVIPAFKEHWNVQRDMYQVCSNHQWRKMSFCFLRTMEAVSPSSTSFDKVNSQVQKADTWMLWVKGLKGLRVTWGRQWI